VSSLSSAPPIAFRWRWILEPPLVRAVWAAALLLCVATSFALGTLRRSSQARAAADQAMARLCAEEAAAVLTASPGGFQPGARIVTASGTVCAAVPGDRPHEWTITAELPRGTRGSFRCRVLDGGAPAAFGLPFAVFGDRGMPPGVPEPFRLPPEELPQPTPSAGIAAAEQNATRIVRDGTIALLRLSTGTDRDDYCLGPRSALSVRMDTRRAQVLTVDGNLWVDAGNSPLTVELDQDLTLLVRGNVYLGRSVLVAGRGRLWIAALPGPGLPYRDLDGNGRWSKGDELLDPGSFSGPLEGGGAIWFGLPGTQMEEMVQDAGIFAGGEVHLRARRVLVRGALVVRHGVTDLARNAELVCNGETLIDVRRDRVPGFAPVGAARPGRLVPIAPK
jgi:hypothetical protein